MVSKGRVVMVDHVRGFGFIEEDTTKNQIFFHLSNYSFNFLLDNGVTYSLGVSDLYGKTYPRKGDILLFVIGPGVKGPKAVSWIYEVDAVFAEAQELRKKLKFERNSPLKKPSQQQPPPPPAGEARGTWRTRAYQYTYQAPKNTPPPPPPPPPKTPPVKKRTWREVLGFPEGVTLTKAMINERYRLLAFQHHPDKGGDTSIMAEVNSARDSAFRVIVS